MTSDKRVDGLILIVLCDLDILKESFIYTHWKTEMYIENE